MFVFHVFAALAEFIRTIIVANTNEGLDAARAHGQRLGRPPAFTPEKVAYCELGADYFAKRDPEQAIRRMIKEAHSLGLTIHFDPIEAA
jgi:DNA invertase Pin-like site-specific DNA recombinase